MYKHTFERVDASREYLFPTKYPVAAMMNTGSTAPNASDCKESHLHSIVSLPCELTSIIHLSYLNGQDNPA